MLLESAENGTPCLPAPLASGTADGGTAAGRSPFHKPSSRSHLRLETCEHENVREPCTGGGHRRASSCPGTSRW